MRGLFILFLFFSGPAFGGATQWLEFRIDDGHITIPVKVHGQSGRALLDSGASVNGINSLFVLANEEKFTTATKVQVEGVFGRAYRNTYNNVPVELYGAEVEIDNLIEMRNFGALMLLGNVFFKQMVLQIDYPNKRLRMVEHGSINLKKLKNINMKINKKLGMPIVKIRLNDEKNIWVLLDTGSTGGLIIERFLAKSAGWLDEFNVEQGVVRGVVETNNTDNFFLPEIKFGPFDLQNVRTTVVADGTVMKPISSRVTATGSHIRSKNVKGIVGYEVLKHFVLTIDYKNGKMHVGLPEEL